MKLDVNNIKTSSQYNDKWKKDNNFHHVLFRHGKHVTLQAGELNEMQSILQEQLKHAGDHLFKNGSIVIPGSIQVIDDKKTLTIDVLTGNSTDIKHNHKIKFPNGDISQIITTNAVNNDKAYCIIDEIINQEEYDENEMISIIDEANVPIASGYVVDSGVSTYATIQEGIIYINGYFVKVDGKTIVPTWYNVETTGFKIGMEVTNCVVTEHDDINLYSSVQGYPDVRAAGAHRLKIKTDVKVFTLDEYNTTTFNHQYDFVEFISISKDNKKEYVKPPVQYNELERYLSKRTYEESGHYIINHPKYQIMEHLKTASSEGRLSPDEGGDINKISFGVKPWLGYIYGNRTDVQNTVWLDVDKPNEVFPYNNTAIPKTFESRTAVDVTQGIPFLNEVSVYDVHDNLLAHSSIIDANKTIRSANSTSMYDVTLTELIYVFDKVFEIGLLTASNTTIPQGFGIPKYIQSKDDRFRANIVGSIPNASITDTLIPIPFDSTHEISDMTITHYLEIQGNVNAQAELHLATVSANETFNELFEHKIILSYESNGDLIEVVENFTVAYSGTPYGRSIVITLPAFYINKEIVGIFPIRNASVNRRSIVDTINSQTFNFNSTDSKFINLDKASVTDIISINIINETLDETLITNQFELLNASPVSMLTNSYLTYLSDVDMEYEIEVVYKHLVYQEGDYTSQQSYSTPIPANNMVSDLSQYIDLRRIIDNNGNIISDSLYPISGSNIQLDVDVIIQKAFSVCINNNNEMLVINATSHIDKVEFPAIPLDAVELFRVTMPGKYLTLADIVVESKKYPNYTMNDIHNLDKRIKTLEYYTSLSLLETQASAYQSLDPQLGIPRFKNGFAASDFKDFAILSNDLGKFQAGINISKGGIHPRITSHPISFKRDNQYQYDNLVIKDDIMMLEYEVIPFMAQNIATSDISVNPYSAFTWKGDMKVFPQTDFWHDTVYTDANVTVLNNTRAVVTTREGGIVDRTQTDVDAETVTNTNDALLRTEISKTMRPLSIRIRIDAVKPVTDFDLYFDNEKVNDLVTPKNRTKGYTITSDRSGKCEMTLDIPASNNSRSFPTGLARISLVNRDDETVDTPSTFSLFESGGDRKIRQLRLNVLNNNLVTVDHEVAIRPVTIINNTTIINNIIDPVRRDPIAQTFYVEGSEVFIVKVGIQFSSKHSDIPVRLQLRPVINGIIANGNMPGAEKVLYPSDVNISNAANNETFFVFDTPVYLQGNQEYAVVVLSDSDEYRAFKATLGEAPVNSRGGALNNQPSLGVFFKSQNGSSWTEDQMSDMTFTLHRAKFNTQEAECNLLFDNTIYRAEEAHFVNESDRLLIKSPGHFLSLNDDIQIQTDVEGLKDLSLNVIEVVDGNSVIVQLPHNMTDTAFRTDIIFVAKLVYDSARLELDTFNTSQASITTTINSKFLVDDSNIALQTNSNRISSTRKIVSSINSPNVASIKFNTTNDKISPMLRLSTSGALCFNKIINSDIDNPIMFAETVVFQFENAFDNATLLFSARLPGSSIMKIDYKVMPNIYSDPNTFEWKETAYTAINETPKHKQALLNVNGFFEYEIAINEPEMNAIAFRYRFASDDGTNDVELRDFRVIAFS